MPTFQIGDVVHVPESTIPWVVVSNPEKECPYRYEVRTLSGRPALFEGQQMTLIERPLALADPS